MASQPALPFATAIDCKIGRRTPRPEIVAQAARVLASYRQPAKFDAYAHIAELEATIPHPGLEAR